MKTYTLLLAVALLCLLASAHAQEPECLTVKKLSSHRIVHPGGNIVLTAKLVTAHCSIPIGTVGAVERPVLSLEPPEGFQAGQPTIEIGEIEDIPVAGHTWMAHEMTLHFTLHALYGAPTGEQAVPGTVTYTAIDEQGNTSSYGLALSIPVQVVPPPKPGYWDQHPEARKAWVTTGEVLLVIIALPWFIVGNILGFYHWEC